MKTANTLSVKEFNRHLVRKQLLLQKTVTSRQLAHSTGLSLMTVRSILAELAVCGETAEESRVPSNGGRPAAQYRYNSGYSHAVMLFGYQKNDRNLIRMRILNLFGDCVYAEEQYFGPVLCDSFDTMLDRAFASVGAIGIIGFGLPGEEENGIVTINDYPSLVGGDFMKHYRERYGVPVLFVNDINAAALGYCRRCGEVRGAVAGLYFPRLYPPGMGLIIDGKIHRGKQCFAGELGCLPLGIEWSRLRYDDRTELYGAVSRLLAAVICTVAPEQLVLYGDFFTEKDAPRIKESTEKLLRSRFSVSLETESSLEGDYESGLANILLEKLYAVLFGEFSEVPVC